MPVATSRGFTLHVFLSLRDLAVKTVFARNYCSIGNAVELAVRNNSVPSFEHQMTICRPQLSILRKARQTKNTRQQKQSIRQNCSYAIYHRKATASTGDKELKVQSQTGFSETICSRPLIGSVGNGVS
jgi:hypothetical protein